jgi:hypothetical protein
MKSENFKLVMHKNQMCMYILIIFLILCSNVKSKNEKSQDWPFLTYYYNVPDVGKNPEISNLSIAPVKSTKNYVSPTIQGMLPVGKINQGIYDPASTSSETVMEKKLDDIENSNRNMLSQENVSILNAAQKNNLSRGKTQSIAYNGKSTYSDSSIRNMKKIRPLNSSSEYDNSSEGKLAELSGPTPNRRMKILKENGKIQKLFENNKKSKINKKELGNYLHLLKKMNSFTMKKVSSMSNHFEKLLLSLKEDIADAKKFKI